MAEILSHSQTYMYNGKRHLSFCNIQTQNLAWMITF